MIVRKFWADQHDTITIEYENGEETPSQDDVIYFEGVDDDGVRVGRTLYDKYNVKTYEVLETGISGSYDDL